MLFNRNCDVNLYVLTEYVLSDTFIWTSMDVVFGRDVCVANSNHLSKLIQWLVVLSKPVLHNTYTQGHGMYCPISEYYYYY